MKKHDFDKIRRDHPLPDIIAKSGVKLDKDGNEFRACCPFHGEKTASFTAYKASGDGTWKYHCFGCGIHGDVVDYVRERYGYANNGDAARYLTGEDNERQPVQTPAYKEATDPYEGYDITRPPDDAPLIAAGVRSPPILNPKRVNPENGKAKVVTYNPTMTFPYKDKTGKLIGYVLRVEFDGRKITPGVWWTVNKRAEFEGWSHGSFPAPRPLYGLDQLYEQPDAQVLLVEGEKCADAANRILPLTGSTAVAVSWMGGGKAISKTYWHSLKGRSVVIWPDNDPEGWRTTMGSARPDGGWNKGLMDYLLDAEVQRIKIVHVTAESRPKGWDIADAEKELPPAGIATLMRERIQSWNRERFELWKAARIEKAKGYAPEVRSSARQGERAEPAAQGDGSNDPDPHAERDPGPPGDGDDPSDGRASGEDAGQAVAVGRGFQINEENWRQHLIMKADGDGLKSTSGMNAALILQYEARFAGIFAWNDFAQTVYLMRRPPWDMTGTPGHWRPRKLKETDRVACAGWLEYTGMSVKISDMGRIITRVAEHSRYNPVKDAFASLNWDGVPRINGGMTADGDSAMPWLAEYMGAENNEINRLFGEKWLVGAVARASEPGCKMDTMLVLEGPQGLQKSTALRVIADTLAPGLFTDEIADPNSKDAGMQMQGALIIEIAELDAFRRAEITQIKSWLARQTDRFRPPYGMLVEEFHRSCVFAGTVNPLGNTGYLKDPTGARRFWPVEAKDIDIDRLKIDGRQLWAEALHLYNAGTTWWLNKEQEKLAAAAQSQRYEDDPYGELIDDYTVGMTQVSLQNILNHLDIPKERRNAIVSRRVTSHLIRHGWKRGTDGERVVYVRNEKETLV